jgi:hypothetical protein
MKWNEFVLSFSKEIEIVGFHFEVKEKKRIHLFEEEESKRKSLT